MARTELFRVHLFTLFLGMWHYCDGPDGGNPITGTGKGFGEGRL